MPPKRAKAAAKPASTLSAPAPKTRATRSKAPTTDLANVDGTGVDGSISATDLSAKKTRTRKSVAEDSTVMSGGESRTTRSRRAPPQHSGADDVEEPAEKVATPKPMARGRARPPRTVKKTVQSEANKAALEGLKKRMQEDVGRSKKGDAPAPETERAVTGEVEGNIAAAAEVQAAPGLPPTNVSPTHNRARAAPSTIQKKPVSTLQRKAPGSIQRGAPGTVQRAAPGSSIKVQSTPGVENSVLALANFRRRARQPSLLQMVQNPELAQDMNDTTDFTDFTLGGDDDEEEFAPYDESTPLQVSRVQQQTQQEPAQQTPSRARSVTPLTAQHPEGDAAEGDEDSLYGATPLPSPRPAPKSTTRKRKSDALDDDRSVLPHSEIQIPRSQPSPAHRSSQGLAEYNHDPEDEDVVPATAPRISATPSPQRIHGGSQTQPQSHDESQISSTFADPMSSPPASPSSPQTQRQPPVPSPNTTRNPRGEKKMKPLTTATLRAMLPKRRIQRAAAQRNDYDIPSSSLSFSDRGSDDAAPKSRRKRPGNQNKTGALSPAINRKPMSRKATTTAAAVKKKTYSRAVTISSDKENGSSSPLTSLESHDGDTSTPPDTSIETIRGSATAKPGLKALKRVSPSGELKDRKAFFDEVDQWEMEFESAPSLGGGMGSSPAWR